jgi:ubiquinone/menaquinone biosynthesis C-methylase UbiE
MLQKYMFPQAQVLEIGSGTGELICYLSSLYNIKATGVDFSDQSITVSNAFAEQCGCNVLFRKEDISQMSFPDNSFDIVFGDQVIGHVENISLVLQEIHRVLKPGGVCLLSTANKLRFDGWDLYKNISDKHQGYTQRSFFPWSFKHLCTSHNFMFVEGYGDMIVLTRNISLIKRYIKNIYTSHTSHYVENIRTTQLSVPNTNKISIKRVLKYTYNKIDILCPWWAKISIGVVVKKI